MLSSNRILSCAMMTKQSKRASQWKVYSCCKWGYLLCTLFAKEWNTFSCFSYLYCIDTGLYSAHPVLKMPLSPHLALEEAACTSASTTAETVRSLSSACFTQAHTQIPFSLRVTDFGVWGTCRSLFINCTWPIHMQWLSTAELWFSLHVPDTTGKES